MRTNFYFEAVFYKNFSGILTAFTNLRVRTNYNLRGFSGNLIVRTSYIFGGFLRYLTAFTNLTLRSNYILGGIFRYSHSESKL